MFPSETWLWPRTCGKSAWRLLGKSSLPGRARAKQAKVFCCPDPPAFEHGCHAWSGGDHIVRTWTKRETPGLADAAKSVKYMQNARLQTSFHMRQLTVFSAKATTDMGLSLAAKCTLTGFVVSSIRGCVHLSVLFALSPSRLDVLQYPACALSVPPGSASHVSRCWQASGLRMGYGNPAS